MANKASQIRVVMPLLCSKVLHNSHYLLFIIFKLLILSIEPRLYPSPFTILKHFFTALLASAECTHKTDV